MEGTDRLNISLPGLQEELLQRIKEAAPGVPLVVALMSGGAVSSPWVEANADAVLWTGFNMLCPSPELVAISCSKSNLRVSNR